MKNVLRGGPVLEKYHRNIQSETTLLRYQKNTVEKKHIRIEIANKKNNQGSYLYIYWERVCWSQTSHMVQKLSLQI